MPDDNAGRALLEHEIAYFGLASAFKGEAKAKTSKVLLVEDNKLNQKFVSKQLERLGFDVTLAENGQDAIKLFEQDKFNLIIMDCMMPVMDGLKATQTIRKVEKEKNLGHTPVVGVTALGFSRVESECKAAGMDLCLVKPVKFEELKHSIANLSQLQERSSSGGGSQLSIPPSHLPEQDKSNHNADAPTLAAGNREDEDGFKSAENSDADE